MLAQGLNPFILTQGYSLFAMFSVLAGAVTNIVLDPIFIFALGMGVRGSSLATVLSQFCSCVWIFVFFCGRKSLFKLRVQDMRPVAARVGSIVSLGFTPFVMTITECAIQIVFNFRGNRRFYCGCYHSSGDFFHLPARFPPAGGPCTRRRGKKVRRSCAEFWIFTDFCKKV